MLRCVVRSRDHVVVKSNRILNVFQITRIVVEDWLDDGKIVNLG